MCAGIGFFIDVLPFTHTAAASAMDKSKEVFRSEPMCMREFMDKRLLCIVATCVSVRCFCSYLFICIHILLPSFGVLCECGVVAALPLHVFAPLCF